MDDVNYQNLILELIESDEDYRPEKDDRHIENLYKNLDEHNKVKVDDIFIYLTGYSLGTIIREKYDLT